MRRIASLALAIGFLAPFLASAPAHAQATRTWVSGLGDDVNPCSRTAPCKTFAGAISKTAAGGEINCLDPGGYGAVTILKAMTLNCTQTLGSILASGFFGITINATNTAADRVVLRGLEIQGVNQYISPGTIGIRIVAAAAVSIEDCVITSFGQQGINDERTGAAAKRLHIRNSIIRNNTGVGIALAAANPNSVQIENTSSINNLSGLTALTGNFAIITRSVFSLNSSNGIQADAGALLEADDTAITSNGTGVSAGGTIRLSNSTVSFNSTGFAGVATSYGNNRLQGNGVFGPAVSAAGSASTDLGEQ